MNLNPATERGCHDTRNVVGDVPRIDNTAFVDPAAVIIGRVSIGPNCYIGPGVVIRADRFSSEDDIARITIGSGCSIQDLAVLHMHAENSISIGDDTIIHHGAIIHGTTSIGRNCFIGAKSVITHASLGDNVFTRVMSVIEAVNIASDRYIEINTIITHAGCRRPPAPDYSKGKRIHGAGRAGKQGICRAVQVFSGKIDRPSGSRMREANVCPRQQSCSCRPKGPLFLESALQGFSRLAPPLQKILFHVFFSIRLAEKGIFAAHIGAALERLCPLYGAAALIIKKHAYPALLGIVIRGNRSRLCDEALALALGRRQGVDRFFGAERNFYQILLQQPGFCQAQQAGKLLQIFGHEPARIIAAGADAFRAVAAFHPWRPFVT